MTRNKELSDPTTKQARRRKVAAVLAGGLVLGVGTMATLASWNDAEFANATFTAGTFELVGSTDNGASWGNHETNTGAASLSFTTPFSDLTPGDSVYSTFALRLAAGTTNDAKVTISGSAGAGSVANLTYQLVKTATPTCDATAVTNAVTNAATDDVLVSDSAVGSATDAKEFALTKAGDTQYLCFKVTAGADLVQGQFGQGIWRFGAESN